MEPRRTRAVSPVIGAVLLVGIVSITAVAAGYVIFSLADETKPAPAVGMELEPTGDGVTFALRHLSGDSLAGDRTRLDGVADEDALAGRQLSAGRDVDVVPIDETVTLYWIDNETSYRLHTFEVNTGTLPFDVGNLDEKCPYVEGLMQSNSGDLDLTGESVVCDVTEDTDTGYSDIDIDVDSGSVVVGTLDTDGDIDVDSSIVAGDVTTDGNDVTITDASDIYGDVLAQTATNVDIDGDSSVTGDVVVDGGSLSLANVDIEGHVYANPGDISSCSDVTIGPNDEDCATYSFRNPSSY